MKNAINDIANAAGFNIIARVAGEQTKKINLPELADRLIDEEHNNRPSNDDDVFSHGTYAFRASLERMHLNTESRGALYILCFRDGPSNSRGVRVFWTRSRPNKLFAGNSSCNYLNDCTPFAIKDQFNLDVKEIAAAIENRKRVLEDKIKKVKDRTSKSIKLADLEIPLVKQRVTDFYYKLITEDDISVSIRCLGKNQTRRDWESGIFVNIDGGTKSLSYKLPWRIDIQSALDKWYVAKKAEIANALQPSSRVEISYGESSDGTIYEFKDLKAFKADLKNLIAKHNGVSK